MNAFARTLLPNLLGLVLTLLESPVLADQGTAPADPHASPAPAPVAAAPTGHADVTPEDQGVLLSEAIYANQDTTLTKSETIKGVPEIPDGETIFLVERSLRYRWLATPQDPAPLWPRTHCSCNEVSCPAGNFCAWGTKPTSSKKNVGVYIGSQLVAIAGDASNVDATAVRSVCEATSPERSVWFVSVPSAELPAGSVVKALEVDSDEQLLKEGTYARTSAFTMDGDVIYRTGSPNGSVGAGVGIESLTRSANKHDITKGPQPDDVSPWIFGVRYEIALFEQDWLHRLAIVARYEGKLGRWSLTPGIALGGGLAIQPSSALTAGVLGGASLHVAWQVTPQITSVLGLEGQLIVSNGETMRLYSLYFGPQVAF